MCGVEYYFCVYYGSTANNNESHLHTVSSSNASITSCFAKSLGNEVPEYLRSKVILHHISSIILFSLFSLPQGDQIRCSPRKYTYKLNQKPPPHRADPAHGAAGPRHARRVLPVACLA